MTRELTTYLISPSCSIREALLQIDRNGQGIVFVVNPAGQLLGTVTDGDVRRAILKGIELERSVEVLLEIGRASNAVPVSVPAGTSEADLLRIMNERRIRQIPLIDRDGRIVDLSFLGDLVKEYDLPLRAVIMAGGFGTRLRPLTEQVPKPMLPVGDRPLLERTIEQLKSVGIRRIDLSTHYKSEVISSHFGDGQNFGVQIEYLREDTPLGTAGALRMVKACDEPLLIMNGDILTQVNFRAMLDYHRAHQACLTVGVRRYDIQVPYGVVESEGAMVTGITEKPKLSVLVNAGIYIVEPRARDYIAGKDRVDMTELIDRLLKSQCSVASFPIAEYWLDVGSPVDYQRAQQDVMEGRLPA